MITLLGKWNLVALLLFGLCTVYYGLLVLHGGVISDLYSVIVAVPGHFCTIVL